MKNGEGRREAATQVGPVHWTGRTRRDIVCRMPVAILHEDDDLLVVDKPAGVVVHPSYKNADGTLLDELLARAGGWRADQRPSIVGRLDKFTSGIVLVAKHARAHADLQRATASPGAEKIYLALVRGVPPESGEIDLPLAHDPDDRRRRMVCATGARSVTRYQRLASGVGTFGNGSLVRCRLHTGRRHQIRVHFASQGWPILGDAIYGEAIDGVARHALHAWRLAFAHPSRRERVAFEAPPPQDFCNLLYSCLAETSSGMSASALFQIAKNRS